MSHQAFSRSWADAWAEELRASDAYREAAATWEGSLMLEMTLDGKGGGGGGGDDAHARGPSVFVDLWRGECRQARPAGEDDLERADFLIRGGASVWKRVLAGEVEPVFGIMSGKLRLVRGSLAKLVPQVAAARELVAAAARIDTVFPAG